MTGLPEAMDSEVDFAPTIRPVLDLSTVRSDATQISSMLKAQKVQVSDAYSLASDIETTKATADAATAAKTEVTPSITEIKYEQNNYSPKALTDIEVYRETKNAISTIKGALESAQQNRSV